MMDDFMTRKEKLIEEHFDNISDFLKIFMQIPEVINCVTEGTNI
jgi:hypothetical protein